MKEELKITTMGKLRMYMTTGESITAKSLLGKMFPKSKYIKIMQEAKISGIRNAHRLSVNIFVSYLNFIMVSRIPVSCSISWYCLDQLLELLHVTVVTIDKMEFSRNTPTDCAFLRFCDIKISALPV